jgi:hypothetical protein
MTKKIKIIIFSGLITLVLASCIRDISVELPRPDDKLVVDAYLELDSFAVVFLTKNTAYFDPVDTIIINDKIIWGNDAIVVVTDGIQTDTLIPAIFDRYPHRGYTGTKIMGSIGGQYELRIDYDNKYYYSNTTIPAPVPLDSIWFEKWFDLEEGEEGFEQNSTFGSVGLKWTDPPGLGDFYSFTGRVEGRQKSFYRPYFTWNVYDDKLDDGKQIMYYPFWRPYDGNSYFGQEQDTSISGVHYALLKVGDTVSIKLSTMDIYSYRFWNSFFRNYMTEGNPFANPASVVSNINGDAATGYWAGYGSYIQTIYIEDSVTVRQIIL